LERVFDALPLVRDLRPFVPVDLQGHVDNSLEALNALGEDSKLADWNIGNEVSVLQPLHKVLHNVLDGAPDVAGKVAHVICSLLKPRLFHGHAPETSGQELMLINYLKDAEINNLPKDVQDKLQNALRQLLVGARGKSALKLSHLPIGVLKHLLKSLTGFLGNATAPDLDQGIPKVGDIVRPVDYAASKALKEKVERGSGKDAGGIGVPPGNDHQDLGGHPRAAIAR